MGVAIRMTKLSDDGRSVTYSFSASDGSARTLVFDRVEDRIRPTDDNPDGVFRAAAAKLASVRTAQGDLPDIIVGQA
jgi:hypothetical protein